MYTIIVTKKFHNSDEPQSLYIGENGQAIRFSSRDAAQSYIRVLNTDQYDLEDGEHARPEYKVCMVRNLPHNLTYYM